MLLNNKQTKYFSLNTNDIAETTKWNIPSDFNFSQKAKMSLVCVNNATDSNLNMVFCPSIKNNFFSSLNTTPLIYAGYGYYNNNIISGKQFYDVNGLYLNEIELKTFSSSSKNEFSYPELDGLKPNLWLKFDKNLITTNSGTDEITIYNINTTPNADYSKVGDNSVSFNGTNHYLTGTIENISSNSFSISFWVFPKAANAFIMSIGNVASNNRYLHLTFSSTYYYQLNFRGNDAISTTAFSGDINNWVHLTFIYNFNTKERMIYRNGVKLNLNNAITTTELNLSNILTIGKIALTSSYLNGYMDDLRIYTGTVLNQDQINQIYNISRSNYPIIKNENLKLAYTTDNDPNIHTIPNMWLRMDTSGITSNSGTDNVGTILNNGLATAGNVSVRGNNSVFFNGTTQYLSGNITGLKNNSFSICYWAYPKALAGDMFDVGSAYQTNTNISTYFSPSFSNKIAFNFGGNATYLVNAYASDANNWVHLAFIYDLPNKKMYIYRNGVNEPTLTQTSPIIDPYTGTNSFTIGRWSAGAYDFFNGNIDDLRVYTGKILTQEEITRIYTGSKTNYTTQITEAVLGAELNPLIWYKFDDSSNIGLDTMGKVNLTQFSTNPLLTYDTSAIVRGSGSAKATSAQTLIGTYNFSDIVDEFTICFWLRISALNSGNDNIITSVNAPSLFAIFRSSTTNNFSLAFFGSGNITSHFASKYTADNVFKHYTITVQKAIGGAVKIISYLNGSLGVTTTTGNWNATGITYFSLSSTTSAILSFFGNLDDLRMYNYVLSPTQIGEIYAGSPVYNFPTISTKYNTDPTNTQYQFEVKDDEQKIISHY